MGNPSNPAGPSGRPSGPVLDQVTVRALCDAGFVSSRDYVDIAAAHGWQADPVIRDRLARLAPPIPPRDSAPISFTAAVTGDA